MEYQEIVFLHDVAHQAPAETLVANLHHAVGKEKQRPITQVPAGVDAKADYYCPALTDLNDMEMVAKAYSVSPDGSMIALLNKEAPRVRVNDVTGTKSILVFEKHAADHLEWSPDNKWFALAENLSEKSSRILVGEIATQTTREVLLAANTSRIRFSWDSAVLYAFANAQDRLFAVDPRTGSSKTVFERPGLHWMLPGPKYIFLGAEDAYYLLDPADPQKARIVYRPKDRGRVLNTEWTKDGSALFLYHADTRRACMGSIDKKATTLRWDHSRAELLRVDAKSGTARSLMEYPALPPPAKNLEKRNDMERPSQSFIHTLWRSPDGTRIAALSREKLFIFDANGKVVYDAVGGDALRWRRDGRSLLVTTPWRDAATAYVGNAPGLQTAQLLSVNPETGEERLLTEGVPFKSKYDTAQIALLDPDLLGDKLIYTMFRVAGHYGSE